MTACAMSLKHKHQYDQSVVSGLTYVSLAPSRRLAKSLPLPVENEESRPRIDLVVFIINLCTELRYDIQFSFAVIDLCSSPIDSQVN